MRVALSHFVIENGPLLRAMRRIPGFHLCAKKVGAYLLPAGHREWFQVRDGVGEGIWLKLNPRSGDSYYRGSAETGIQAILRDYLKPGMVFYDLGSNIGFFSLLAARIVGPAGKVIAFEAEPRLESELAENRKKNGADNVRIIQSAVWSHSGFVDFDSADKCISPDLGIGKVVSNPTTTTISVPSICLDDFVRTERPPDFIKCDVEGAEVEVFRGARKVLTEYRPFVECEIHSDENGELLRSALRHMKYDVRWYSARHLLAVPSNRLSGTKEETN